MPRLIFDRASYKITSREVTDEGFLSVPGRVARTGVQDYLACELGLDGDPNRIVRVMRPESEVFKQSSLDTYNGVDVTIEHPQSLVTADTYKAVTAGVVRSVGARDGDFVQCELLVKDQAAIDAINSGKVQLSAGYTSVYKDAPADADYEFIQTDIKINHVALVDRARAGNQAKLFDNKPTGDNMPVKVVLDSGRTVEIADEAVATLVTDTVERLQQAVKDAEAKASKTEAEKDAMKEDLEEEKKKSSDAAISARVADIAKTMDAARKVAGDTFACDSLDIVTIQREALKIARPKRAFDGKSNEYITAAFDMEMEEDEDEKKDKKKSTDSQHSQFAQDAAAQLKQSSDARQKVNADKASAWKKTAGDA